MKLDFTDRLLYYRRNSVNSSNKTGSSGLVLPHNASTTHPQLPVTAVRGRATTFTVGAEPLSEKASDVKFVSDSAKSPGKKFDAGKAPVQQAFLDYFPLAIAAVANISAFGASKYNVAYSDQNWRQVEGAEGRYRDAKGRHAVPPTGELYAQDSNLLHAAHEAWNAMAVLELMLMRGVKERNEQ